jgi:two-component system, sensor histidine kinase PdtaS
VVRTGPPVGGKGSRLCHVSTLRDLVEEHTDLRGADVDHLQRLAGDWQLISDLSFADLVLWAPVAGQDAFVCIAQVRPTTAPTAHQDDQVGNLVRGQQTTHLTIARTQGRIWREGDPVWYGDTPARHEAIPVRRRTSAGEAGGVIAVVARDTNLSTARTPSQLELNYLTTADDLAQMVADGTFPPWRRSGDITSAPRVGDGLIRLDAGGRVTYASPNAQSAFRRLGLTGHLVGDDLAGMVRRLADDPLEGSEAATRILAALGGETPARREIEVGGAIVLMRALPLVPAGVPIGALVLVRDVTEVRRRDRALLTKDATIREIHHRVKNNLQTVAALLRLQARRTGAPEARVALEESVRRVGSIAIVHETLAMSSDEAVAFDGIVDRLATAAAEVALPEAKVTIRRVGSFGTLPADVATPLALALNELLLNAVEHGFAAGMVGEVVVEAQRRGREELRISVADTGRGLPEGYDAAAEGLGLHIVRTLVAGELRGTLELRARERGAEALLVLPLTVSGS